MKFCFWFFAFPFLIYAELDWQSSMQGCSINLHISAEQTPLYQPLTLKATFNYPLDYAIDIQQISQQLSRQVNPLSPLWLINEELERRSKSQDNEKITQKFIWKVIPLIKGRLKISLLNVTFVAKNPDLKSLSILTPIFEIHISDALVTNEVSFAPLIHLEPQFPLSLSVQNQQNLYLDPKTILAEEKRNVRLFKLHTFPWAWVLVLFGLMAGIGMGTKLFKSLQQKKVKALNDARLQKRTADYLLKLKNNPEWKNGPYNSIFLQLNDFYLKSLHEQFGIKLSSSSLEEQTAQIQSLDFLPDALKKEFVSILNRAHYIKFASVKANLKDCEDAYQISLELSKLK